MIHLGDVTKIKGGEAPIVDVIVGGSPCQDLSVAGTRSGLDGERSGLFMEQIRIIKEMREKDREDGRAAELVRPRWMVWENVVGAFSSGKPKGADFQRVLTEIVRIAEPDAPDVPMPDKGWPKAGWIYDDMGRWSVAWRTHDAQYFGVAQRRRRIALVADFSGLQAPEVIFDPQYRRKAETQESAETVGDTGRKSKRKVLSESESLFGDSKESAEEGQGTSCSIEGSVGEPSATLSFQEIAGKPGGGKGILIQDEHTGALVGNNTQNVMAYGIDQQGGKGGANYTEDVSPTVLSDSHGTPHAVAYGIAVDIYNQTIDGDVAATLTAASGLPNTSGPKVMVAGFKPRQSKDARTLGYEEDVSPTLSTDQNFAALIRENDASL